MLITAGCVAFNEYVLGYHSLLARTSPVHRRAGARTVFRFWAMHLWVFPEARAVAADGDGKTGRTPNRARTSRTRQR